MPLSTPHSPNGTISWPSSHRSASTLPSSVSQGTLAKLPSSSSGQRRILSVASARLDVPLRSNSAATVAHGRTAFRAILRREDRRSVVIAGPCSIHHPEEALEYAQRLRKLSTEMADRVLLLMRVYFEKPRTSLGWKGLLSDPHLDGSNALEEGILISRRVLCWIADLGVPTATEFIDPLIPAYLSDFVSWVAIGARTTESPTHRQMASGLPTPVGFKNSTDGSIEVAINAVKTARASHAFLGVDDDGRISMIETEGNPDTHLVLRGAGSASSWRTNYSRDEIAKIEAQLDAAGLPVRMLLDCSHANCGFDFRRQRVVAEDWIAQRQRGESNSVFGLMFESNLREGKQSIASRSHLKAGISITDGCIGWTETEDIIRALHASLPDQSSEYRMAGSE